MRGRGWGGGSPNVGLIGRWLGRANVLSVLVAASNTLILLGLAGRVNAVVLGNDLGPSFSLVDRSLLFSRRLERINAQTFCDRRPARRGWVLAVIVTDARPVIRWWLL